MSTYIVGVVALVGLFASLGCPPPADALDPRPAPVQCLISPNRTVAGVNVDGVYFGTRAPSLMPINNSQIRAIVGLSFGRMEDATCSGTLISDQWVLTARHCTAAETADNIYVLFGTDDEAPELVVAVDQIFEHSNHDMALWHWPSGQVMFCRSRPFRSMSWTSGQMTLEPDTNKQGMGDQSVNATDAF